MTKDQEAALRKGSIVVSPDSSPPWCPLRVTEVAVLKSGGKVLRIAKLPACGWMSPAGFLMAPAGASFRGRWVLADNTDVTPKRADLDPGEE